MVDGTDTPLASGLVQGTMDRRTHLLDRCRLSFVNRGLRSLIDIVTLVLRRQTLGCPLSLQFDGSKRPRILNNLFSAVLNLDHLRGNTGLLVVPIPYMLVYGLIVDIQLIYDQR